jgi:hypothetical protein
VISKQATWYNGMASTTQQAACPNGYTGTGGGVQCQAGGYVGSWAIPVQDASSTDTLGHHPVIGWSGACATGPTTTIAVCCPACPSCTQSNDYGSYSSGSGDLPPPPPPPSM